MPPPDLKTPKAMQGRPLDPRGFPVPWFSAKLPDGTYDLRYSDPARRLLAIQKQLCWISGKPLGKYRAFVIDPEAYLKCFTREPPCRREMALWACQVCPYLSSSRAQRQTMANTFNSGVHAVWVASSYRVTDTLGFELDPEPLELLWFRHRQQITEEEAMGVFYDASSSAQPPVAQDVTAPSTIKDR